MQDIPDASPYKTSQRVDDILGAVTFNIIELSRLSDLYRLAEERGIMNVSPGVKEDVWNKLQELMRDVSKIPHYLFCVWNILGDEQFREFFLFYQCALQCANSNEKAKDLFQVINAFRSSCNTNTHINKLESQFYKKAYTQWRSTQPQLSIVQAVEDQWEKEIRNGPNSFLLMSPSVVPKDAFAHCQLDDDRLTDMVVHCLWTAFCMPYVKYKKVETEHFRLGDLRTLRPTAWLNDVVIAGYTTILQSKTKDCVLIPRSARMGDPNHPFKCDTASDVRNIRNARKKVGENTVIKKILIPRNYNNIHWSLVAIELSSEDRKEVVISHYDSAFNHPNDSPEELKRLRIFAKEVLLNGDSEDIKYKSVVPNGVPKQTNDYDCGVFVCMMAATLSGALHFPFLDINQAFITDRNCRASICASILTEELVPPYQSN